MKNDAVKKNVYNEFCCKSEYYWLYWYYKISEKKLTAT